MIAAKDQENLVVLLNNNPNEKIENFKDLTVMYDHEENVNGLNIKLNSDNFLLPKENGNFTLNDDQLDKINDFLSKYIEFRLHKDEVPKFVVGHVDESVEHPDSDHLHITQIDIGLNDDVQIVCGAPNIEKGQNVVVALPEAVMPNGQIIWPGELRGVPSFGMVCSARELGIKSNSQEKGIMVLSNELTSGDPFIF